MSVFWVLILTAEKVNDKSYQCTNINCKWCYFDNLDNCIECNIGYFMNNNQCVSSCPNGKVAHNYSNKCVFKPIITSMYYILIIN